jgi:Leucine-rich repeat (LRR) protein
LACVWADGLCGLYLDRNTIRELPEQCAKFKCLTALSIADNLMTEFPSWIGTLPCLKTLAAPRNHIAHVCEGVLLFLSRDVYLMLAFSSAPRPRPQ